MFSYGFVYNSNPECPGYNQYGVVRTAAQAKKAIKERLLGKGKVTFSDESADSKKQTQKKVRALVDGKPTGYIFFPVKLETWVVVNGDTIRVKGKKGVLYRGSALECKLYLQTKVGDDLRFVSYGDNIDVEKGLMGGYTPYCIFKVT